MGFRIKYSDRLRCPKPSYQVDFPCFFGRVDIVACHYIFDALKAPCAPGTDFQLSGGSGEPTICASVTG
jgi:hypothetical protein